jgi:hypothetical protein
MFRLMMAVFLGVKMGVKIFCSTISKIQHEKYAYPGAGYGKSYICDTLTIIYILRHRKIHNLTVEHNQ